MGSAIFKLPVHVTGATSQTAGKAGLVPPPAAGDENKVLKGNGTWGTVEALPAVTTTDNGKVLMVVNGAWAAESIPAASGVNF